MKASWKAFCFFVCTNVLKALSWARHAIARAPQWDHQFFFFFFRTPNVLARHGWIQSHFTRLTQLVNGRLFVANDKCVGSSWQRKRTLKQTTDCVSVYTDDNQEKEKKDCDGSSFHYLIFHNKGSRRFRMMQEKEKRAHTIHLGQLGFQKSRRCNGWRERANWQANLSSSGQRYFVVCKPKRLGYYPRKTICVLYWRAKNV